jgi:predicted transcriptional regulator
VYLYDASAEAMSVEERAALDRALERSLVQADAGELVEADEVLAELQRP